jgi:hypothetical protein
MGHYLSLIPSVPKKTAHCDRKPSALQLNETVSSLSQDLSSTDLNRAPSSKPKPHIHAHISQRGHRFGGVAKKRVKEWGQEFFITFLSKLLHHEEKWLLT